MQKIIYNKTKDIDLFCYEDTEFYDKYNRAIYNVQDRLEDSADLIIQLFGAIIRISTIIKLFMTLDIIFIVAAVLMCIQSLIFIKFTNKITYNQNLIGTPINRKMGYIEYIFRSYQFVKELKIYQFYNLLINKYKKNKDQYMQLVGNQLTKFLKLCFATNFFGSVIKAFVNLYVIYYIIQGKFTVGDFSLVFTSVGTLSATLNDLIKFIPNLINNDLYIRQLQDILNYEPQIITNLDGRSICETEKLDFIFQDVTFSYPNAPDINVLNKITIDIKSGSKIALVGHNGSGKSTFVKLLLYLYKQDTGAITCNENSYDTYNTLSLRSVFGVIFQDFQIYKITIAENILMRKVQNDKDEKLIWSALEFSGLSEKILSLDNGIYTVISQEFDDEGAYLSGGEQQKLAIARAYARNASVMIFDEPTSALDPIAEYEIFEKLMKLGREKTVIFISHRLAATVNADQIYVFDNGNIIEHGTHESLMLKKGQYYEMFTIQSEKYVV